MQPHPRVNQGVADIGEQVAAGQGLHVDDAEAEFVADESAAFPAVRDCVRPEEDMPEPSGRAVVGVDWGLVDDYTVAVTLDADGQHDPDFIPHLVKPVEEGEADLVIGSRFVEGGSAPGMSPLRRLALRFLNLLGKKATKLEVRDTQSGMRAYSRRALEAALEAMERSVYSERWEYLLV